MVHCLTRLQLAKLLLQELVRAMDSRIVLLIESTCGKRDDHRLLLLIRGF